MEQYTAVESTDYFDVYVTVLTHHLVERILMTSNAAPTSWQWAVSKSDTATKHVFVVTAAH